MTPELKEEVAAVRKTEAEEEAQASEFAEERRDVEEALNGFGRAVVRGLGSFDELLI